MRRTLGLVAAVVALSVMARAQLPGENPQPGSQFPRVELYGGYSYGLTDLFNSGQRVGLNGWNASLGLNAAKWMGFVVEGSGYYGTSKIPLAVPAPFPTCPPLCPSGVDAFNVKTRLYNYMFGAQFPYRKWDRLTPFGEALFGHSGIRGEARSSDQTPFARVGTGMGLMGGGGVDYKISPRLALRFKADYLQTRGFKLKQDNVRFSIGVVIRSVHKKRRTLEEETPPAP
ncbi:MAG TPA: outer membrane beta-barrel protein [Terriglobales bacterium]